MTTYRKIVDVLTPTVRKRQVSVLLILMIIGMVVESLGIGLVIPVTALLVLDNLPARYPSIVPVLAWLGNPSQQSLIVISLLTLVCVYLAKAMFLGFLAWWQIRFVSRVQIDLSQRLFTTYLQQPYTFHLQHNSAGLIVNVTSEVSYFCNALSSGLVICTESFVLLAVAALLLATEPIGALIVVMVVGGVAWGFHYNTRIHITRWGRMREHHDVMRVLHLQQGLNAVKDVKVLGREEQFLSQYSVHNTQSALSAQNQGALLQLPRLWLELLAVIGLAVLVLNMIAQGRELASIMPAMGLFAAASFRLIPSVGRVMGALQSVRYGLPAIDIMHRELKLGDSVLSQPSVRFPPFKTDIQLTDVTYAYPGTLTSALNSISLTIQNGECVGFIGSSGSGKSTLIDVILGLLTPSAGYVKVDGNSIQQSLRAWQSQIGYVPQSIYLTDDTLKRNVAFGMSDAQIDDAAVQRAIKAAQLEEFVSSLPDGLETMVGERGVRLSGGQRQRIGMARALYHDPAVLVLDEATSALDTSTESGVMQAVTALKSSKTILIVAHRLSTVHHCDRIYRLEQGKVVSNGTPAEMLASQMDSSILDE